MAARPFSCPVATVTDGGSGGITPCDMIRVRPVDRHKANLFLPRLYENFACVGEIGECDVVLRLFGEFADG